jgi:DNA-binding LacI/PurR family transcriptional regulator
MLTAMGREERTVGMAEIATAAGVAVSTVSRALSGAPGVSTEQRRRIVALAREMGYLHDDPPASRRAASARILAVIPEPDRWVFGSILAGLHDVLTPAGAQLTVVQGLSASDRGRVLDLTARRRSADVVVLVPMVHRAVMDAFTRHEVPVVIAGSAVPAHASVGIDDLDVGQKATNYLINTGYRRIGYATYADHDGKPGIASALRRQGYLKSLERAGLEPDIQISVRFGPRAGQDAAERLLAGEHLPDAFVVSSDEMAAGMVAAFGSSGVRVPEDVALIGVDDHPVAELLGITTIAQPAREQGRVAASMVLSALAAAPVCEPIVLPTRLVVRETTRRRPGRG